MLYNLMHIQALESHRTVPGLIFIGSPARQVLCCARPHHRLYGHSRLARGFATLPARASDVGHLSSRLAQSTRLCHLHPPADLLHRLRLLMTARHQKPPAGAQSLASAVPRDRKVKSETCIDKCDRVADGASHNNQAIRDIGLQLRHAHLRWAWLNNCWLCIALISLAAKRHCSEHFPLPAHSRSRSAVCTQHQAGSSTQSRACILQGGRITTCGEPSMITCCARWLHARWRSGGIADQNASSSTMLSKATSSCTLQAPWHHSMLRVHVANAHVHLFHCLAMPVFDITSSLLSGTPMAPLLITELKGVSPATAPMSATHSCNSAAASIFMPYLQSLHKLEHTSATRGVQHGRQARGPGHPPDVYEPSRFDSLCTGYYCAKPSRVLPPAYCVAHEASAGRHTAFQGVRGRPQCLEHWAAHGSSGGSSGDRSHTGGLMSLSSESSQDSDVSAGVE